MKNNNVCDIFYQGMKLTSLTLNKKFSKYKIGHSYLIVKPRPKWKEYHIKKDVIYETN